MLANQSPTAKGRDRYKSFVGRCRKTGTYFDLFRDFTHFMTLAEVAFVGNLLNYGKVRADDAGWVWATGKFLTAGLGIDREQQAELIDSLTARGYLEMRLEPTGDGPPRRMLRVVFPAIERALAGEFPAKPAKPVKPPARRLVGFGLSR